MSGLVGGFGYGHGGDNTIGTVLVLFILLVIISASFKWGGFGGY